MGHGGSRKSDRGKGRGGMRGSNGGDHNMQGGSHREMMGLIHKLFDNRDRIKRSYNKTNIGIESYTRSDDPQVGEWIQTHV